MKQRAVFALAAAALLGAAALQPLYDEEIWQDLAELPADDGLDTELAGAALMPAGPPPPPPGLLAAPEASATLASGVLLSSTLEAFALSSTSPR